MKTNENYGIWIDSNLLENLTFTEAAVYSIIKEQCEKNDDGVCRLNNDKIANTIHRGSMMVSLIVTALVKKGLIARDITYRAKRLLTLVNLK